MKKIIRNPLNKKIKISMDLDEEVLRIIKSLANLTNSSKGEIVESISFYGFSPLINSLKISWEGLLTNGNLSKEKNKKLKDLLKSLSEIEKDWESQLKEKE